MDIYELLSVGMIILLGLLGGKLFHRMKIPRVTGYMVTGLIFGPSLLGWISSETLEDIHMINDIALGLILFAIGGELQISHLKSMGSKVIWITLAESMGAFVAVTSIIGLTTGDWSLAFILGAISIATAPGVTLLVIREYRARGTLTDMLLAVVALNNILCLVIFKIVFELHSLTMGTPFSDVVLNIGMEFLGSLFIGLVIGAIITFWEQKIDDLSELLLVIIGGLLLGIGAARTLGISYLMVCLIIGAVTNNLSMMHRLIYAELRQIEMPFYIAFFVLSGASLHLDRLWHLGILGVAYLLARPFGKFIGSYVAGRRCKAEPKIVHNLGMGLLPQAGVAIGMYYTIAETNAVMSEIVGAVILSSVIVYEAVGPILTKISLQRAGEVYLQE